MPSKLTIKRKREPDVITLSNIDKPMPSVASGGSNDTDTAIPGREALIF